MLLCGQHGHTQQKRSALLDFGDEIGFVVHEISSLVRIKGVIFLNAHSDGFGL
ncbi:hypothetical protein D3C85_1708740 [compost metagenome]